MIETSWEGVLIIHEVHSIDSIHGFFLNGWDIRELENDPTERNDSTFWNVNSKVKHMLHITKLKLTVVFPH